MRLNKAQVGVVARLFGVEGLAFTLISLGFILLAGLIFSFDDYEPNQIAVLMLLFVIFFWILRLVFVVPFYLLFFLLVKAKDKITAHDSYTRYLALWQLVVCCIIFALEIIKDADRKLYSVEQNRYSDSYNLFVILLLICALSLPISHAIAKPYIYRFVAAAEHAKTEAE